MNRVKEMLFGVMRAIDFAKRSLSFTLRSSSLSDVYIIRYDFTGVLIMFKAVFKVGRGKSLFIMVADFHGINIPSVTGLGKLPM